METKKIVFKRLCKVLSENEMKRVTEGYGNGYPWVRCYCPGGVYIESYSAFSTCLQKS